MCAWFSAPQVIVVHRRQIIMHQRVGMQHFHRSGDSDGTGFIHPEQRSAFHHQEGAQPLAAAQRGIAHRLGQPAFGAFDGRQQDIERLLHDGGGASHLLGKIRQSNGSIRRHT
jgi:hypothetical protein